MNNIIRDQLLKVSAVKIAFGNDTTYINIPKSNTILNSSLKRGDVYTIELEDFMLSPASNSVVVSNWNAGKVPKYKIYKAELVDKVGNMFRFNGIPVVDGKDIYSESFYYWLSEDGFKVISKC